jgi:hypothetical protein
MLTTGTPTRAAFTTTGPAAVSAFRPTAGEENTLIKGSLTQDFQLQVLFMKQFLLIVPIRQL